MEAEYGEQAKVFKAFCDENRLKILALLRGGEKCACVLLGQLELGQSGLSYHMRILADSGVVECRQEGKWTYYSLSTAGGAYAEALLKKLTTPDAASDNDLYCKQQRHRPDGCDGQPYPTV